MIDDKKISLPFSETKQKAVVGYLISNEKFFRMVYHKIKPSWFISTKNAQLLKLFIQYYEEYRFYPTIFSFKSYKELDKLDLKTKNDILMWMDVCLAAAAQFRVDELKKDFTEWLHSVIMLQSLSKAEYHFNQQDIKKTNSVLQEAVKEVNSTNFDGTGNLSFANFDAYIEEFNEAKDNALGIGLSMLDSALLQGATTGGLLPGDTTIIIAPVNVGKTTFLITVACHNVRQGKDVLFVSHEGNPKLIRLMFLANMVGCSISQVLELGTTKEGREKVQVAANILEKHLTYIPYNKSEKMVVEEFIPTVIFNHEQRKQELGKGYDLFLDDYPFILNTELAFKGSLQKRNADAVVFNYFVQLGLEYGFHVLAAMQTNREGNKINKKMNGENRILQQEDASEAFGPVMQANNIITLNRSPVAEQMELMTFGISKTRTNKKGGLAIIAKTDYSTVRTHSNDLGCMGYYGSKTIEEKWASLSPRYMNSIIPLEQLRNAQ